MKRKTVLVSGAAIAVMIGLVVASHPEIEVHDHSVILNSSLLGIHNSSIWDQQGFATAWNNGADSGTNYSIYVQGFHISADTQEY